MRKFLWGMLIALMMAGMQSCENNTNFGNISPNKLPNAAKSFIEQYFADQTIVAAEKEMDDGQIVYEVTLSDGTELDFDENGEWTDVDCQNRQVPDGIVPEKIRSYVATNYPDNFIVEIEHKYNRYRIELNNDKYGASPIELRFDNQFNYTGDTNPAKAITVEQLPDTSSTFVEQFFPGIEVVYAEKDEDDGIITYELTLADGTEIEVDANGNWIEIECFRRALPDGIVPQPIVDYVAQNYPNGVIVTIERDDNGYEISGHYGRWLVVPVEYKHGVMREDDADRCQLCAQAYALEEMFSVSIEFGFVYHNESRRREKVLFSEELRKKTKKIAYDMSELFLSGGTPEPVFGKHCNACSLKEICMPKISDLDVDEYICRMLEDWS